jgi:hypothetical protein
VSCLGRSPVIDHGVAVSVEVDLVGETGDLKDSHLRRSHSADVQFRVAFVRAEG